MDRPTRFFFIAVPVLMVVVLAITLVAISNRRPPLRTPIDVEAETATTADSTGADKILYAPGKGTLSGVLLAPDGEPNTKPVSLHYRSQRWETDNSSRSASGTLATGVTDTFSYEISSGETILIAEGDGYAISSFGPIDNYAYQVTADIQFQLEAGQPLTIHVQDTEGKPITDAELAGRSRIEGSFWGHQKPEQAEAGAYVFPHVAASAYRVRCSAPGFEPTEFEVESPQNATETVVLTPGIPTTGVVLDAGGQPVPEAKLLLLYRHPNHYYGGKELGEADEQGEFRLLNLSRKHQYSGILQAPDGRCGTFENLKPGRTELTLHITTPPRLTGTVHGNLEELSWRDKKRSVRINQRVPLALPNGGDSLPYNSHAPVETQDDEQTFTFNGLLTDDWELIAGDVRYQHGGSEGDVHLDVNLETGEVLAKTTPINTNTSQPRKTIPGRLLKPDGSRFEGDAKLLYVLIQQDGNTNRTSIGGLGTIQREFNVPVMPHESHLVLEADGYALTVVQPFARQSEQKQEEIEIVLDTGQPLDVQVQDLNGAPISDAKLELRAFFHCPGCIARRGRKQAEQHKEGMYIFPNVANRPHEINIKANGFEDTTVTFYHLPTEPILISMETSLGSTNAQDQ